MRGQYVLQPLLLLHPISFQHFLERLIVLVCQLQRNVTTGIALAQRLVHVDHRIEQAHHQRLARRLLGRIRREPHERGDVVAKGDPLLGLLRVVRERLQHPARADRKRQQRLVLVDHLGGPAAVVRRQLLDQLRCEVKELTEHAAVDAGGHEEASDRLLEVGPLVVFHDLHAIILGVGERVPRVEQRGEISLDDDHHALLGGRVLCHLLGGRLLRCLLVESLHRLTQPLLLARGKLGRLDLVRVQHQHLAPLARIARPHVARAHAHVALVDIGVYRALRLAGANRAGERPLCRVLVLVVLLAVLELVAVERAAAPVGGRQPLHRQARLRASVLLQHRRRPRRREVVDVDVRVEVVLLPLRHLLAARLAQVRRFGGRLQLQADVQVAVQFAIVVLLTPLLLALLAQHVCQVVGVKVKFDKGGLARPHDRVRLRLDQQPAHRDDHLLALLDVEHVRLPRHHDRAALLLLGHFQLLNLVGQILHEVDAQHVNLQHRHQQRQVGHRSHARLRLVRHRRR
mmetsp:Transcript_60669/g.166196  ORF Transcript_60669/g.166196 Transcript_60669/m.166196 type:complete len:515 (-) Transcript_60669:1375-2919(-)